MKKQLPKSLLPVLLCTMLALSPTTSGQTKENPTSTDNAKREQILQTCGPENEQCICMAEQFDQNLNEKDWVIILSLYEDPQKLPEGMSEADIKTFLEKFERIDKICNPK